jgi:eukaryotic-like serine/threonine-protein kinase
MPPPDRSFGPFTLLETLGEGGMGVVYRAREPGGREVALKVLRKLTPDQQQRFEREGVATAALQHPGIVRVHSAGSHEGVPYLSYELIENHRDLLQASQACDLPGRVALVRDAARALGHAHSKGVVHRDVKPSNVLVDEEGRVRVTDFGLAHTEGEERLTRTGALVGTPLYWAPEVLYGSQPDPTADVFALGLVLHQVLTGVHPLAQAESHFEALTLVKEGRLTPPSALVPELDSRLDLLYARATAPRPADRFPHGEALAQALEAALAPSEPEPRGLSRRLALGACLILLALSGATTLALTRPTPTPRATPTPTPQEVDPAAPPAWFSSLPNKPPLPLPTGLEFAEPGTFRNVKDGSILVWVPPATFDMGSTFVVQGNKFQPEDPPHSVRVERGFFLGKYELRNDQYQRYADTHGIERGPSPLGASFAPDHPVFGLSWLEARAYCSWAGLRLPSEQEWELAARGTDGRLYPWGPNPPSPALCNAQGDADGWPHTSPVNAFPAGASPVGCLGMVGNVSEWTATRFALYPGCPTVAELKGLSRVIRGGQWYSKPSELRATARRGRAEDAVYRSAGLRVCRSLD